jgi:hypothetical protein
MNQKETTAAHMFSTIAEKWGKGGGEERRGAVFQRSYVVDE